MGPEATSSEPTTLTSDRASPPSGTNDPPSASPHLSAPTTSARGNSTCAEASYALTARSAPRLADRGATTTHPRLIASRHTPPCCVRRIYKKRSSSVSYACRRKGPPPSQCCSNSIETSLPGNEGLQCNMWLGRIQGGSLSGGGSAGAVEPRLRATKRVDCGRFRRGFLVCCPRGPASRARETNSDQFHARRGPFFSERKAVFATVGRRMVRAARAMERRSK